MSWAFAHASTQWLLQLLAAAAALWLAPQIWSSGPLLIGFLLLLGAAAELLGAEARERRRLALAACLLGQTPGVALALYVAACIAGPLSDPQTSMVLLQLWTVIWSPLLSLVPPIAIRGRGAYVWVTLALPFAQLACALWPLVRRTRQPAERAQPASRVRKTHPAS